MPPRKSARTIAIGRRFARPIKGPEAIRRIDASRKSVPGPEMLGPALRSGNALP
jgi:hypothetical protein